MILFRFHCFVGRDLQVHTAILHLIQLVVGQELLWIVPLEFFLIVKQDMYVLVGKNQSTSPLQFAAASCIAPLPQPTIPISVNNGPVLRLDGLVIMCSDPVELPTIVTRIIRCTYFRYLSDVNP